MYTVVIGLVVGMLTMGLVWWYVFVLQKSPCTTDSQKEPFTAEISMQNTTNMSYPLIDYVVKASAHSAYNLSSNTVSLDQLRNVIKRGCRWIDFDIFSVDHLPVVGFTTTPTVKPGQHSDSLNVLPFAQVMTEVQRNAFSTLTAPNANDPLFINIRIKSSDSAIYSVVQTAMSNSFGSMLYTDKIQPNITPLAALSKRAILVIDTLYSAPEVSQLCDNTILSCAAATSLRSIAGLLCGTTQFPLTLQSIQLKQAPVPVMPGDPAEILLAQKTNMGYKIDDSSQIIDSFKSAMGKMGKKGKNLIPNKNKLDSLRKATKLDPLQQCKLIASQVSKLDSLQKSKLNKAKQVLTKGKKKLAEHMSLPENQTAEEDPEEEQQPNESIEEPVEEPVVETEEPVEEPEPEEELVEEDEPKFTRATTATKFRCSIPNFSDSKTHPNPDVYSFIKDYGIQVVPFRFYKDDMELIEYEKFFSDNGHTAFISLATAIKVATTR